MTEQVARGGSHPLGATLRDGGVQFSVYSKHAHAIDILLFDDGDSGRPSRVISLDPRRHRTYHYWHAFVPGIAAGQVYAYRAHGSWRPELGRRFDPAKVLLDPYGRAVHVPAAYDREAARRPGDNGRHAMKSIVADLSRYDWEDDAPPCTPFSRTVIYEMHVRGFTRHASSEVAPERRGTYAGLIDKIPYLAELGITAVEFLPVFQFDPHDAPPGLVNYWGYAPVSFFAPHVGYSRTADGLAALDEFRDLVKALHRAGIEVILDVVYNHTTEGDHTGPTLCFRGLANDAYYLLEPDRARYSNLTGTGNTLRANHPIVRRLILDSLRYWVAEMHVDGFRFDLASILSRDDTGRPIENPPIVWDIESDPVLASAKLIAEAWDAAGLYQVGSFVGDSFREWNGRFRDDVRSFVRGDRGHVSALATRLLASPDLYDRDDREPDQSVNFVTCHDGFTLNDLVSYDRKHNEANLEDNRDGADDNRSSNHGTEGPTDDPAIEALRNRQVKNFLTLTLFAMGTPMILMGDEVRRTQLGNNNAYCQDNELSWFDWTLLERHADVRRFVRKLIRHRLLNDAHPERVGRTLTQALRRASIRWHGVEVDRPDWSEHSHTLAFTARLADGVTALHGIVNAYGEPLRFALPPLESSARTGWRRWIDTALDSPADICTWDEAPEVSASSYLARDRSVVALYARIAELR